MTTAPPQSTHTARKRTKKIPTDKTFFHLGGGLHTESSALTFPSEVTLDEENFEIYHDGSRKRRRGLNIEEGTDSQDISNTPYVNGDAVQTITWRDVNNDPTITYIVVQLGQYLHFYLNGEEISDNKHPYVVNLGPLATTDDTESLVSTPVSLDSGRGHLFLSGKNLQPSYISYTGADSEWTVESFPLWVREFKDVVDIYDRWGYITASGGEWTTIDEALADLPNSFEYNLRNRGWLFGDPDISAWKYALDLNQWPSKAMYPYAGWKTTDTNGTVQPSANWYSLGYDTKAWDSDKIEAELFGNSDIAKGSLIYNVFDTRVTVGMGASQLVAINNAEMSDFYNPDALNDGAREMTFDLGYDHDLEVGDYIECGKNGKYVMEEINNEGNFAFVNFDVTGQSFEIVAVDTQTVTFYWKLKIGDENVSDQAESIVVYSQSTIPSWRFESNFVNDAGEVFDIKPKAVAWYNGRVFHAGMDTPDWADHVFFSKIISSDTDYGTCYQAADPTHPAINALVGDDGGTIQIPNVGNIIDMVAMDASLLVFADQGVWEITGANNFTATDVRVRQITSAEAVSASGIVEIESGIIYTSHRGIYFISRSGQYGGLVVNSLTEGTIQSLWNSLSYKQQEYVQVAFDESKGLVYFLYNTDSSVTEQWYDAMLVLDMSFGAFYKYVFDASDSCFLIGVHSTDESSQPDEYKKMKFFIINETGTSLSVADFSQDKFTDFCGTERIPFLLTGYDNLSDFSRQRYAPVIHTFMKKTETGYTDDEPVGESSLTMQARWDFSNHSNSNKYGRQSQIYKHRRMYVPDGESDNYDSGEDVIKTRTKVRGRGKALQLYFEGEEGKDAHILGWAIHYNGVGEI